MNAQTTLSIGREALVLLLSLTLPVILTVLVIGVVIGIFQAITQIQEATLSFAPKLIAAVVVLILFGPWMLNTLVDYIRQTIESIPQIVL